METFIYKNQQKLRYGYTTGSCAAAAAKAAAITLLSGDIVDSVELLTPKGIMLSLQVQLVEKTSDYVMYAVIKDGGDDPDVTDGMEIIAKVNKCVQGFSVDGGYGIGRVTKEGLACAVGEAAINPKPRAMIVEAVKSVTQSCDYRGGLAVEISAPEGERVAAHTFNPRLGIVGGISILGTSGIVEPMSEKALIDTIKVEMQVQKAAGAEYILVTPGNYGEAFAKIHPKLKVAEAVKCSNFLGETLDLAVALGFKGLLLVGHMGKMVKVAAGVMNTHSKYADCRMEVMTAHAALQGASVSTLQAIMSCVTTDEVMPYLQKEGIAHETVASILKKIDEHLKQRVKDKLIIGAIVFSNVYGILGETKDAGKLAEIFINLTKKEEC